MGSEGFGNAVYMNVAGISHNVQLSAIRRQDDPK